MSQLNALSSWADPGNLPPDTVEYTAAIIHAIGHGTTFVLNGW